MGCLGFAVAVLLALAVPASIAPASLAGAYVVLAVLAVAAVAAVVHRGRRPIEPADRRTQARLVWVAALTTAYAVVVTVIHLSA